MGRLSQLDRETFRIKISCQMYTEKDIIEMYEEIQFLRKDLDNKNKPIRRSI